MLKKKNECLDCGVFIKKTSMRCVPCNGKAKIKKGIPRNCQECGKEFQAAKWRVSRDKVIFCSTKCHGKWRSKNKIGKNAPNWQNGTTNIKCFCQYCGVGFLKWQYEIDRGGGKYCSMNCQGKDRGTKFVGENSPNWKGGISTAEELDRERFSRIISPQVLERDSHTCRGCGAIGGSLHAHHIYYWNEYPELRFDLDNCITLCVGCHYEEHHDHPLPEGSMWGCYVNNNTSLN